MRLLHLIASLYFNFTLVNICFSTWVAVGAEFALIKVSIVKKKNGKELPIFQFYVATVYLFKCDLFLKAQIKSQLLHS